MLILRIGEYLDIQGVPQSFHQQDHSFIPHWVEVFRNGLTPEDLLTCNLKLHIWITRPYKKLAKEKMAKGTSEFFKHQTVFCCCFWTEIMTNIMLLLTIAKCP